MRYVRVWVIVMVAGAAAGCATTPEGYERRMQDTYAFIESWERVPWPAPGIGGGGG